MNFFDKRVLQKFPNTFCEISTPEGDILANRKGELRQWISREQANDLAQEIHHCIKLAGGTIQEPSDAWDKNRCERTLSFSPLNNPRYSANDKLTKALHAGFSAALKILDERTEDAYGNESPLHSPEDVHLILYQNVLRESIQLFEALDYGVGAYCEQTNALKAALFLAEHTGPFPRLHVGEALQMVQKERKERNY